MCGSEVLRKRNPPTARARRQQAYRGRGGLMRYFLALFAVSVLAVVGILGFRGSYFRKPPLYIFPDMEWQLKLRPQKPNGFFADGFSSRLPVAGTVARSSPIQTKLGPV